MDIKTIPTRELMNDLYETIADIKTCQIALSTGVTEYSGGAVQRLLDVNIEIRKKIEAELEERGMLS